MYDLSIICNDGWEMGDVMCYGYSSNTSCEEFHCSSHLLLCTVRNGLL
jgi:hypothetical protein